MPAYSCRNPHCPCELFFLCRLRFLALPLRRLALGWRRWAVPAPAHKTACQSSTPWAANGCEAPLAKAARGGRGIAKPAPAHGSAGGQARCRACSWPRADQVEPYLPVGSKLWGRTRIGLRCIEPGARPWNVFLPVTVQAWGMGWVLNTNVNAGETLDARQRQPSRSRLGGRHLAGDCPARRLGRPNCRPQLDGPTNAAPVHGAARRGVCQRGHGRKSWPKGPGLSLPRPAKRSMARELAKRVKVRMDNGRLVSGTVNAQGGCRNRNVGRPQDIQPRQHCAAKKVLKFLCPLPIPVTTQR